MGVVSYSCWDVARFLYYKGEHFVEENRRGSWGSGLSSLLLVAILIIVAAQFVLSFIDIDRPLKFGEPSTPGDVYTAIPMDPGTSGLFGRVVVTNKRTGESWIIFPKGTVTRVSLERQPIFIRYGRLSSA